MFILAGGQSRRMGRDKARARIGRSPMLALVSAAATSAGLRVRIVRRDAVPRCGPMGGVVTALRRSRADALVFLACDMPFVPPALIRKIAGLMRGRTTAAFVTQRRVAGFPFALRRGALRVAGALIARGEFSLQSLARETGAKQVRVSGAALRALANVNTREDLERARIRAGGRKR